MYSCMHVCVYVYTYVACICVCMNVCITSMCVYMSLSWVPSSVWEIFGIRTGDLLCQHEGKLIQGSGTYFVFTPLPGSRISRQPKKRAAGGKTAGAWPRIWRGSELATCYKLCGLHFSPSAQWGHQVRNISKFFFFNGVPNILEKSTQKKK